MNNEGGEPPGEKGEELRSLIRGISRDQLKALGHESLLREIDDILHSGGNDPVSLMELQLTGEVQPINLRNYLSRIKEIPDEEEAAGLLKGALYGIPAGGKADPELLAAYSVAAPHKATIQTDFNLTNPSKNKISLKPNLEETRLLLLKIAGSFIPKDQTSLGALRRVSKWDSQFIGRRGSLEMTITPPARVPKKAINQSEWAYRVEIRKV